jgi:hypothetical protein
MMAWTDSPVNSAFRVKFFVDTNILSYLIDNTYEGLTGFLDLSKKCVFVDLVSSKYVIFEYVGVRKREHYLRKVAASSKISTKGEINFSSLLNLRNVNSFSAPEVEFDDIVSDIKTDVENELLLISSDYGIDFGYSNLNEKQMKPTFDVCLSSKISNQDSLVLVSSIFPNEENVNESVVLLTNDDAFSKSLTTSLETVINNHGLHAPEIKHISKIENNFNLKMEITIERLTEEFNKCVISLIQKKNKDFFLGKTFSPIDINFPSNILPFKLAQEGKIKQGVYATVVSSQLDFIYTSKTKVTFWHNGSPAEDGFVFTNDADCNISYKIEEYDDENQPLVVPPELMNALRTEGNLVFIHPDSCL